MTSIDDIPDATLKILATLLWHRISELRSKSVSDQLIFSRVEIAPAIDLLSKQAPIALESILKS